MQGARSLAVAPRLLALLAASLLAALSDARQSDLWGSKGEKWTPEGPLMDFSYAGESRGQGRACRHAVDRPQQALDYSSPAVAARSGAIRVRLPQRCQPLLHCPQATSLGMRRCPTLR